MTIAPARRRYGLAVITYLAIPAVVIAGARLFVLIDPEMARGRADYVAAYRRLALARDGVLIASGALAVLLWIACCCLVLRSRRRSLRWLVLAVAGPLGFSVLAGLRDRAPMPGDLYQRFIGKLKPYWRAILEIGTFVATWTLAYTAVVLKRTVMIHFESLATGTPASTIIAQQTASSGMWAAGEGMEAMYLVPLIYLLWPLVFNRVARWFMG